MDTEESMDRYRTDPSPAQQVQQQAAEVTEQTKQSARRATGHAQESIREQLNTRSTQAGGQMRSTAEDLRSIGEELRKQGKDVPARWVDLGADRLEGIGRYLIESDADKILRDVEEFGRRQPWATIAGGVVLGFLATRVFKPSSSRGYDSTFGDPEGGTQAPLGSDELPVNRGSERTAPRSPSPRLVVAYEESSVEAYDKPRERPSREE
ncbi:MAG: hypothetical protein M3P18_00835 [Actinomycetota bacterium]|nr:hypothetical protein [Actinomycetota bacterium]